jgi:hypothetical protein
LRTSSHIFKGPMLILERVYNNTIMKLAQALESRKMFVSFCQVNHVQTIRVTPPRSLLVHHHQVPGTIRRVLPKPRWLCTIYKRFSCVTRFTTKFQTTNGRPIRFLKLHNVLTREVTVDYNENTPTRSSSFSGALAAYSSSSPRFGLPYPACCRHRVHLWPARGDYVEG